MTQSKLFTPITLRSLTLDNRIVLVAASWQFAGTGHATTAERQLALAAAARARERNRIAREEIWTN